MKYNKIIKFISILVLISLTVFLIFNRNNHFQECDSSSVYSYYKNFPVSAFNFTSGVRPAFANIEVQTTIANHLLPIIKSYFPDKSDEKIYQWIGELNLITAGRIAVIKVIDSTQIPGFFKRILALPLSSTYSFSPGVLYSLIYSFTDNYEDFISTSLVLTISIFILSGFILYRVIRNIGCSVECSLFLSSIYLFSISSYSYAFHLGSTIWIIFSTILWFYVLGRHRTGEESFTNKFGYFSLLLTTFNYLISLFYISYLLYLLIYKKIDIIKKDFIILIILFIVFVLMFFPFGNTIPNPTNLDSLSVDFKYIILNLFSFIGNDKFINQQFYFGLFLSFIAIFCLIFSEKNIPSQNISIYFSIKYFAIIYVFLVYVGILGFSPTRHLLFLGPLILILVALQFSLYFYNKKININHIFTVLFLFIVLLGFNGLINRSKQVLNNAIIPYSLFQKVDYVLVNDCSFNLIYMSYPENIKILMTAGNEAYDLHVKKLIDIPVGKKILYVSQTISFDRWLSALIIEDMSFKYFDDYSISSNIFFTAFNPDDTYTVIRFMHNRPNNFYYRIFELDSLVSNVYNEK